MLAANINDGPDVVSKFSHLIWLWSLSFYWGLVIWNWNSIRLQHALDNNGKLVGRRRDVDENDRIAWFHWFPRCLGAFPMFYSGLMLSLFSTEIGLADNLAFASGAALMAFAVGFVMVLSKRDDWLLGNPAKPRKKLGGALFGWIYSVAPAMIIIAPGILLALSGAPWNERSTWEGVDRDFAFAIGLVLIGAGVFTANRLAAMFRREKTTTPPPFETPDALGVAAMKSFAKNLRYLDARALTGLSSVSDWSRNFYFIQILVAALAVVVTALYPVAVGELLGPAAVLCSAFAAITAVWSRTAVFSRHVGFATIYVVLGVIFAMSAVTIIAVPVCLTIGAAQTTGCMHHTVRIHPNNDRSFTQTARGDDPSYFSDDHKHMNIAEAAGAWRNEVDSALSKDGTARPIIFVSAAGGGQKAGLWTAYALGTLEDCIPDFHRSVFGISAVSGGALGAANYTALLKASGGRPSKPGGCSGLPVTDEHAPDDTPFLDFYSRYGIEAIDGDGISPLALNLFYNDVLFNFTPFPFRDRAYALEKSWERDWRSAYRSLAPELTVSALEGRPDNAALKAEQQYGFLYQPLERLKKNEEARRPCGEHELFSRNFMCLWDGAITSPLEREPGPEKPVWRPALFLNGMFLHDGERVITTNLKPPPRCGENHACANGAEWKDVSDNLVSFHEVSGIDIAVSTAVHNSARFPGVSPAGAVIGNANQRDGVPGVKKEFIAHIIDGGYSDNSGSRTLSEIVSYVFGLLAGQHADNKNAAGTPRATATTNNQASHAQITPVVIEIVSDLHLPCDQLEREGASVDAADKPAPGWCDYPEFFNDDALKRPNSELWNELTTPLTGVFKARGELGSAYPKALAAEINAFKSGSDALLWGRKASTKEAEASPAGRIQTGASPVSPASLMQPKALPDAGPRPIASKTSDGTTTVPDPPLTAARSNATYLQFALCEMPDLPSPPLGWAHSPASVDAIKCSLPATSKGSVKTRRIFSQYGENGREDLPIRRVCHHWMRGFPERWDEEREKLGDTGETLGQKYSRREIETKLSQIKDQGRAALCVCRNMRSLELAQRSLSAPSLAETDAPDERARQGKLPVEDEKSDLSDQKKINGASYCSIAHQLKQHYHTYNEALRSKQNP